MSTAYIVPIHMYDMELKPLAQNRQSFRTIADTLGALNHKEQPLTPESVEHVLRAYMLLNDEVARVQADRDNGIQSHPRISVGKEAAYQVFCAIDHTGPGAIQSTLWKVYSNMVRGLEHMRSYSTSRN